MPDKIKAKDVEEFINAVSDARRDLILEFQSRILKMYPQARRVISYNIPMYKTDTGWVGLGYWKQGVTLYTGHPPLILAFSEKHPELKTRVGCINFRLKDAIPWGDVTELIATVMEARKPQNP